jgi:hypothetical protein
MAEGRWGGEVQDRGYRKCEKGLAWDEIRKFEKGRGKYEEFGERGYKTCKQGLGERVGDKKSW